MTDVEICNTALAFLGDQRITSLSEDVENAELCTVFYARARDEALSTVPWSFARKRADLTNTVNTPAFDWSYEATLPSDNLRVLKVVDMDNDASDVLQYEIAAGLLLSDVEDTGILYIAQITDTTLFSPMFCRAVARLMASYLAVSVNGDPQLGESMRMLYEKVDLPEAQYLDVVQDQAGENSNRIKVMRQGSLRNQRFNGLGYGYT